MTELHLIRLPIKSREFTAWALDHGFLNTPPGDGRGRPREADIGYALHALLCGLFGTQAPRPFAIPALGQGVRRKGDTFTFELLGYARAPIEVLHTLAQLVDSDLQMQIDWDSAGARPMPTQWPPGLQLRFDLRACPVRRVLRPFTTKPRPGLPGRTIPRGSEVDAYQLAAVRARDSGTEVPTRGKVYAHWLAERLGPCPDRDQAVSLVADSAQVVAYRSVRLLRRPRGSGGRRCDRWLTRPDVRFTGLLRVVDPAKVTALLASGVGRHSAFGFGMLLLRPA
ncbi:MAG: type I-E CRISPR-associated protein Cas6/Cse3/CasE [Bryobacterales bacterium]|nr:type I-E CRISPR-associated protein Cas6/Cse3/CasE [Bryobacterales bacterium]